MPKEYSLEEFKNLPPAEQNVVLQKGKVKGTAVVKGPDGKIKYDNPDAAGQYKEENLSNQSEE